MTAFVPFIQKYLDVTGESIHEAYEKIRRFMDRQAENVESIFEMPLDKAHGRLESRKFWISEDIDWFEARGAWAGLKSIM